jgi:hypothetical protein
MSDDATLLNAVRALRTDIVRLELKLDAKPSSLAVAASLSPTPPSS